MKINSFQFLTLFLLLIGEKGFSYSMNQSDSLVHTFNQNKFNIEGLGLSFQREMIVSRKNTVLLSAGIDYAFVLSSGDINARFGHSTSAILMAGGRHYYKIKRNTLDRKQNIGNFIGVDVGYKTAPIVYKDLYLDPLIFCRPHWGIQRAFSKNGSFELGLGVNAKYGIGRTEDNVFQISPSIQLRLGWIIRKKHE